jgi:hypothetical protein
LFDFQNPMLIPSLKAKTSVLGNRDLFICDTNVKLYDVFKEGVKNIQKDLQSNPLKDRFDHFYTRKYVIGAYPNERT